MWISFLIATTLVANALASCPEGWTLYPAGQKCLKVYGARSEYRSFPDARHQCQGHGGDLVQVKDSAMSDFIGGLTQHWYWMGAWDQHRHRQWSYVDGTPVDSYHPWRRGEPNNSGNREYCVLVVGSNNANKGQWNDGNCADRLPYICEIPAEVTPCPEGWTLYPAGQKCLKVYGARSEYRSFPDARHQCQGHGGDLVQVKDSAMSDFIGDLTQHWYWMGAWDEHRHRQWSYVDGTPVDSYHPWRRGDREYCVLVVGSNNANKGQWNDGNCADRLPYICEIPAEVTPCQEGWTYYPAEDTCIKTSDSSSSFNDARQICQEQGGDLVQNRDSAKTEFVGSLFQQWYWMGVWDEHHNRQFEYVDATPLGSYHPWRSGEPNNSGNREFCVLVVGTNSANKGQWNDGYCNDKLHFVCEKPSTRRCPEGYHHYVGDNSCVKAYPRSIYKNYEDTRGFCRAEGGDMVQVRDAEKSHFVGTLTTRAYWMGVRYTPRTRQWFYLDETPLADYHPWNRGEPNNAAGSEFCVMVHGSATSVAGKWNDDACSRRKGVVCEIA